LATESRGSDVGKHRQPGNWSRPQAALDEAHGAVQLGVDLVREARSGPHLTALFCHIPPWNSTRPGLVRRVWAPARLVVPANFESRLFLVFSFPAVLDR